MSYLLVSIKKQLLSAAIMWSAVGIFLFLRGVINISFLDDPYKYLWVTIALALGIFKAKFVLEKTAKRIIERILKRDDPSHFFGFLPLKSWILIGSMIGLGILLRHSPLNRSLVWSVYVAIGAALFASSRIFWKGWKGVS